jgi:hypothetical protein
MKKFLLPLFLLITMSGFAQVRISAVYGGGGNTGATYNQDFVVIFNAGTSTVSLSTYSLQYASATGPTTSPFNWAAVNLTGNIAPGGYYLVAFAIGTNGGIPLPLTADATLTSINLSGTTGKIALVNSLTLLNGANGPNACSNANVADVIGYGSAATCSESSPFITTGITTAQCIKRTVDCTDNNNNSTDLSIIAVNSAAVLKNSSSAPAPCTSPVITASPTNLSFVTDQGTAVTNTFNLSGTNLSPAAGSLTVTVTAPFEVSSDGGASYGSNATFNYTAGALASTVVTVRVPANAAAGALTGTATCSGGGAANAVVNLTGGVAKLYYSNATGNLAILATWGDMPNGMGSAPADFTSPYQKFIVANRTSAVLGAPWSVTGTGSKIIIGIDNEPQVTVTTAVPDTIENTNIVDISNSGVLNLQNQIPPTFGELKPSSSVIFSYNGANRVLLNPGTYGNVTLSNGQKYFKAGTFNVTGNFFANDCTINGGSSPFTTLVLRKNLTNVNAAFEDSTTGFPNRLTLQLSNPPGLQFDNVLDVTGELALFRLTVDTTDAFNKTITLTSGGKITIGNNSNGGDLRLLQKAAPGNTTTTQLNLTNTTTLAIVKNGAVYYDAAKSGVINATGADVFINKSVVGNNTAGTLKFATSSTLNDFTVNITSATRDTINVFNNVTVEGNLDMLDGRLVMQNGSTLSLGNNATTNGGNTGSYVEGKVSKSYNTLGNFIFPVGKNNKFAPVEIEPTLNATTPNDTYTVEYFKQAYSTTTVNPTTLATIPTYSISNKEYWDINRLVGAAANVRLYYDAYSGITLAPQARLAHFNGSTWDDIGRNSNGATPFGTYIEQLNVNDFSPFTFGGAAGVLPIRLSNFAGVNVNTTNVLSWSTTQDEIGDMFELQHSTDGTNFVTIYTTAAIGGSNGNSYNFKHVNIAEKNFYRLALINNNGTTQYSKVLALHSAKQNFNLQVNNSNSKQVMLSVTSAKNTNSTIQVVNAAGQIVFSKNIAIAAGVQQIYLSNLQTSTGVYYLNYKDENANNVTKTLVF